MAENSFIGGLKAKLGIGREKTPPEGREWLPPVPKWRPSFAQQLEEVVDRISYYIDRQRDLVVFEHGTCVILEPNFSDTDARIFALDALAKILKSHPDMHPSPMDDGNILVRYNEPAANVVLASVAQAHWPEVERSYLDGLTPSEVLITPLGANVFDDFGKQALLGRAYMFMDAQAPVIVAIKRQD